MGKCAGTTRHGTPSDANAMANSPFCCWHAPEIPDAERAKRVGERAHPLKLTPGELRMNLATINACLKSLTEIPLALKEGKFSASIAQTLIAAIRAHESPPADIIRKSERALRRRA